MEVFELMDKIDFNNNGTIDYSEFMILNVDTSKMI